MDRLRIKDLAEADRPREKLLQKGIASLSDVELLAIILSTGNSKETAVELAQRILNSAQNSLNELGKYDVKKLTASFYGVGQAKALTIIAALELGKRRKAEELSFKKKIVSSKDIYTLFLPHLTDLPHEECWILLLSRSHQVISKVKIGQGGVSNAVADVRIIMKEAIVNLASSIVLCHNHPSGNLHPSRQDDELTMRVFQTSKLLDISLIDHLIIGDNGYYSYADEERLPKG
jgi:DNA repair protein RadC